MPCCPWLNPPFPPAPPISPLIILEYLYASSSILKRQLKAVYDEVLDLLTCTEWDGDIHAARAARSELSEMLGVSVPAVGSSNAGAGDGATSSSRVEEKPRKVDELESYKSLVRSTGY